MTTTESPMQATADGAEAAVLGAALIGADLARHIIPHIVDDQHMWGREAHRVLWEAIVELHEAGVAVDTVSVLDRLRRDGTLDVVGGPVALADLAASAPSRSQADHWAGLAAEAAQRRRAWHAARQLMTDVIDPQVDPWSALARLQDLADQCAPADAGLDVISGTEILDLPETEWLIDGWWPQGTCAIWGRRSTYKSFAALSIALSVATGRPWWGHKVSTVGDVVYIPAEGRGGIAPRLAAAADTPADLDRMHVVSGALQLTDQRDIAKLDRVLSEIRPVLTIIDTWGRLSGVKDENDNASANHVIATLDRLRERHGTSWLLVHHSSADDSKARGATSLEDGVEASAAMRLDESGDGTVLMENSKPPKDAPAPAPMKFRLRAEGRSAVMERVADGRGVTDLGQRTAALLDDLRARHGEAMNQAAAIARYGAGAVERLRTHREVDFGVDSNGVELLRIHHSPL